MPYKDKEKNKECIRLWKEKNPDYQKNYDKKRRENKREYLNQQKKEYSKTENGIKARTISGWKNIGVINTDFNSLYNYYLNCKFCEECNVELTTGNNINRKCLDHDHTTGKFRNVLCNTCNCKRGYKDRGHIKLTRAERNWKYNLKVFILS